MKKLFLVFSLLCYSSALFAAFDIKLGVFQDIKNLHKNIAKIKPYTFRKQIIVNNKKGFYYTHAIIAGSRSQVNKALKAYQTIFTDAFIAGETKEHPKVGTKKKIKKTTRKNLRKKKIKKAKKIKSIVKLMPVSIVSKVAVAETLDAKTLLANKTVYLCYEDGPVHLKGRVVQLIFNEINSVTYVPLDKSQTLEIDYSIENNRIVLHLSDITMIHKVIEKKDTYLRVESYVGSKKMYVLRYYFNLEDALKFLK